MDGVVGSEEAARFQGRLRYFAWRRYRIPPQVAEDLVQAALLTYLEVRDRYPNPEEHPKILVGIFRNKCREHIDGHLRAERRLRALRAKAGSGDTGIPAVHVESATDDGVVGEIVRREELHLVLQALAELRPSAREMFRLIVEEGASRKDLIRRYGLNKNTLDSRLRAYRRELRTILAKRGIEP